MKTVTYFVADNGSEFKTEKEALSYNKFLYEIKAIYNKFLYEIKAITETLPKRPDSCSFSNGEGYIQHTKHNVEAARLELFKLACRKHKNIKQFPLKSYVFARTLDDSGSPLYPIYIRLVSCIDDNTWREFGQPYFVDHQAEIKGGPIN